MRCHCLSDITSLTFQLYRKWHFNDCATLDELKNGKNGSVEQHYYGYRMIFQVTYYQNSSLQKLKEVKFSILRSIVQIWWTGLNVTRIKQKQTKIAARPR